MDTELSCERLSATLMLCWPELMIRPDPCDSAVTSLATTGYIWLKAVACDQR
jgi:hypothetical protein